MATPGDYRARFAAGMLNEDFQAALNRIIKKKKDISSMTQPQKDVITGKLEDTADYIDNFGPISALKDYFVETKGFSEGDWSEIEKVVQKLDAKSIDYFVQYIKNPVKIDYFKKMTETTNVVSQMEKDFNLPKEVTSKIFDMSGKMKAGKGVGKGELFLGFMVDGATNAATGDVNADGVPYEVKGKEARLNTQNGFANGSQAMKAFFKALGNLGKGKEKAKYSQLATEFGNTGKDNIRSYNFFKGKNGVTGLQGSRFYELIAKAKELGADQDLIIKEIAKNVFTSGIWQNGSSFEGEVISALQTLKKPYNSSDDSMMNYKLMWTNIKYYQMEEPFNGIFITLPGTGKMAYLPVDKNSDKSDWLSKHVKYTQPSWQDNPTSNSWKIELK